MISFWIFLTLSVSHLALAAPLAVGEIVEVRSNPVQVHNDGAMWEKRMDPNYKDQLSTNDVQLPDGGAPDVVQEGVDAEGVKPKQMWGWGWDPELPSNSKELWSAISGPDASHNNPPKPDDAPGVVQEGVDAEGVKQKQTWGWGWDSELPSNSKELWSATKGPDASHNNPPKQDDAPGVVQDGVDAEGVKEKEMWGWGWDSELPSNSKELWSAIKGPDTSHNNPPKGESGGGDHAMESSQGSAENINLGPQPEHPATSDFMTYLKEWFYKSPGDVPKVFRPRSRTAGAPKGVSGNR
jgi:hypothetical protein